MKAGDDITQDLSSVSCNSIATDTAILDAVLHRFLWLFNEDLKGPDKTGYTGLSIFLLTFGAALHECLILMETMTPECEATNLKMMLRKFGDLKDGLKKVPSDVEDAVSGINRAATRLGECLEELATAICQLRLEKVQAAAAKAMTSLDDPALKTFKTSIEQDTIGDAVLLSLRPLVEHNAPGAVLAAHVVEGKKATQHRRLCPAR